MYLKNAINQSMYSYCERFHTQLVWVFYCMTILKKVKAIFSSIFRGHLLALKLSSIEPSPYLDGWPPFEKIVKLFFYFFMHFWILFSLYIQLFPIWVNKMSKNSSKKCGKKGFCLIEVHFLIAGPNGHPSKSDWARCCCKSLTKWPWKLSFKNIK